MSMTAAPMRMSTPRAGAVLAGGRGGRRTAPTSSREIVPRVRDLAIACAPRPPTRLRAVEDEYESTGVAFDPAWAEAAKELMSSPTSNDDIQGQLKNLVKDESKMMNTLNKNRELQQQLIRQMVAIKIESIDDGPEDDDDGGGVGEGAGDSGAGPVIPDEFKAAPKAKKRSGKLGRLAMQRSRKKGGLAASVGNTVKSTGAASAAPVASAAAPAAPPPPATVPRSGSTSTLTSMDYDEEGDAKFNEMISSIDKMEPRVMADTPCLLPKPIYIVSDCTGESAAHTVRGALGQFESVLNTACPTNLVVHRFVKSEEVIYKLANDAANDDALIVYTLVEPKLVQAMQTACKLNDTKYVDMWSNLLDMMEDHLEAQRSGIPFGSKGRRAPLASNYFELIQAVEYTRKMDDGANPQQWHDCDLLLLGVSRTGKTPLSIYLGQRGYKVANLPLVPGVPPPKEVWEIPQDKIFCLTIRPDVLQNIRRNRLGNLGVEQDGAYDNMKEVQKEVEAAGKLYAANPSWPVLDVTLRSVEESAARILEVQHTRTEGKFKAPLAAAM